MNIMFHYPPPRAAKLSEAECWRLLNIRVEASAEPPGEGEEYLKHVPIQNNNIICCEILLRPFVEQTHFITVGIKTKLPIISP